MSDSIKHLIPVEKTTTFSAGNIANYSPNWKALTSDTWILNCIEGYEIPVISEPFQNDLPRPFHLSLEENNFVNQEIKDLLQKGLLKLVEPLSDHWISNIFYNPNQMGSFV